MQENCATLAINYNIRDMASFKIGVSKVQDIGNFELSPRQVIWIKTGKECSTKKYPAQ